MAFLAVYKRCQYIFLSIHFVNICSFTVFDQCIPVDFKLHNRINVCFERKHQRKCFTDSCLQLSCVFRGLIRGANCEISKTRGKICKT